VSQAINVVVETPTIDVALVTQVIEIVESGPPGPAGSSGAAPDLDGATGTLDLGTFT
jgi:hypothetical protein